MGWNPNATDLLGLEWMPTRQGGVTLASDGQAVGLAFTSSVTQSINSLRLYMAKVVGTPQLAVDVWVASGLPQTVTTATYRPSGDATPANATGFPTNTPGNLYTNIDEAVINFGDYVYLGGAGYWQGYFASGAHAGTDNRALRTKAVVLPNTVADAFLAIPVLKLSGIEYWGTSSTVSGSDGQTTVAASWTTNPATGQPWTQAEIQAFASTAIVYWNTAGGYSGSTIRQTWIEVDSVATLPVVSATLLPTAAGWVTPSLPTPSAQWSKLNATAYVVVVRKVGEAGTVVLSNLDAPTMPHGHTSYVPTVDTNRLVTALGSAGTPAYPLLMEDITGASSIDSQPYVTLDREAIYSGRTVQQEFTPAATVTRAWVRFLVSRQGSLNDGDLLVKVKRRSDDVQAGGTLTVTAADVASNVVVLRQFDGVLASTGSFANATQYYVEWSSTAPDGLGWVVGVLNTQAEPITGDVRGFGGATDAATVAGVESTDQDVPVVLGVVPAAPSGLAVVAA